MKCFCGNAVARFRSGAFMGVVCLAANTGLSVQIAGVYNTGVDAFGNVLPLHSIESHYAVSGVASVAYVVPKATHPVSGFGWMVAPPGAAWIGPNSTANTYTFDPDGTYHYTLSFDLTGYNPATARITGSWAADNSSGIWLNGNYTGFGKNEWGFLGLDPFDLTTGFVPGINTLEFRVVNDPTGPGSDGNPSGLLVSGITTTVVPEPSVLALAGLGFAALTLSRRRRVDR
jgi:hypothetical protein